MSCSVEKPDQVESAASGGEGSSTKYSVVRFSICVTLAPASQLSMKPARALSGSSLSSSTSARRVLRAGAVSSILMSGSSGITFVCIVCAAPATLLADAAGCGAT
ncbi:hypothetical protein NESM_000930400 [Novymonas esmeraldas]|uniref:Uncharacterized protein n=1 Tax=Novymonas esmeraldas TaxID=1808958 RepID=A0AAW0F2V0_9TRYP